MTEKKSASTKHSALKSALTDASKGFIILIITCLIVDFQNKYIPKSYSWILFGFEFVVYDHVLAHVFGQTPAIERIGKYTREFFEGWWLIIKDWRKR